MARARTPTHTHTATTNDREIRKVGVGEGDEKKSEVGGSIRLKDGMEKKRNDFVQSPTKEKVFR